MGDRSETSRSGAEVSRRLENLETKISPRAWGQVMGEMFGVIPGTRRHGEAGLQLAVTEPQITLMRAVFVGYSH